MANLGSDSLIGGLLGSVGGSQASVPDYYRELQGQQGNQWQADTVGFGGSLWTHYNLLGQLREGIRSHFKGFAGVVYDFKRELEREIVL